MRIKCSQCGADLVVLESDFLLRCPYCDARILVQPPTDTTFIVSPSVNDEYVSRLFPSGMAGSVELMYFPYLETAGDRKLIPCFNQPWHELEDYTPPDGDRKVFDEDMVDPDSTIPFDRDLTEEVEGRLVFHPFFVVMLNLEGYREGMLVDGVSGKMLGEVPESDDTTGTSSLYVLFLRSLAGGLLVSVPIYFLSKSLDASWLSRIWSYMAVVLIGSLLFYFRKGRSR